MLIPLLICFPRKSERLTADRVERASNSLWLQRQSPYSNSRHQCTKRWFPSGSVIGSSFIWFSPSSNTGCSSRWPCHELDLNQHPRLTGRTPLFILTVTFVTRFLTLPMSTSGVDRLDQLSLPFFWPHGRLSSRNLRSSWKKEEWVPCACNWDSLFVRVLRLYSLFC